MQKKILMVSGPHHPNPPLKGAAVETWMYEVSKRVLGYEAHIVSIAHPFYPVREYKDGIFFHRIHFSKLYKRLFQKITKLDPLSYPKRIARIVDEVRPDIVHMHNMMQMVSPLVELININNIKTVLHMHNEVDDIAKVDVDLFLGCSNFVVNSYKDTSLKAIDSSCIYNGVDLNKFRPCWEVQSLRDRIRSKFGITKDEFVVLFVGRMSPEKGVEHFINSAFRLNDKRNIRFFIIGEIRKGPAGNDRVVYGQKMIKMAAPLKDKIIFTDVFPPSGMNLLYLLGDALVVPSNFEEPFGMVAIEAMATGLPVIARRKGGITEYLIDGFNGFLIDEKNVSEGIVDKIGALISDNKLREKIGTEGRKTVEERFSWETIVAEVEEQYGNLIG